MPPLLPSGAPYALLPAHAGTTASTPMLTLVEKQPYAFHLGAWVFVPMMLSYLASGVTQVVRREPRQIMRRWCRGGEHWYQVKGHDWVFHEDELEVYDRVIDFFRRTRAVAAA
jgi:hypothetical protein